jgi:hypothetical protein
MNPQTTGRALVITQAGYTYHADVSIAEGLIHATSVIRKIGRGDDAFYRRRDDRVWMPTELREIRWLPPEDQVRWLPAEDQVTA